MVVNQNWKTTGPQCIFFADTNPLFGLTPEPTNHCIIIMSCDAASTKRQRSHEADLLTLSEYRVNKHLTGVKALVRGHHQCESTNAFYREHIIVCK